MEKNNNVKLLILILIFFGSCELKPTGEKTLLNSNWEFYFDKEEKWYPAKFPGNIHTDLYNNRLIDDPFYCNNEKKLQWIGEKDWTYRTNFIINEIDKENNFELVFEGLDTYAEIFLNNIKIGTSENMFLKYSFPIADSILKNKNLLEVKFSSPAKYNKNKELESDYTIPDNRVHSRKAQYHSGWDWGPKFETVGIYKNVYLQYWQKFRIKDIKIEQNEIYENKANLTAHIKVESENLYQSTLQILSPNNQFDSIEMPLTIYQGENIYPIEFSINDPKLWWCNGIGKANLYDIEFKIETKFRHESRKIRTGIRTVELITDLDEFGQEFYFKLNGKKVFARGANWVPAEFFNGNNSREKYLELLNLAKEANFNMIRVWGGGIYENDEFYEICDSLGIMVWQDFMFACAMYPNEENFFKNVANEIDYQINRLYNHPSIVLWCGNNEISNGWFDWGWQKQFSINESDSIKIWEAYDKLFHRIIPEIVLKNDKSRRYVPSSPFFGWGRKESNTHGAAHYWGVWWGLHDFRKFFNNTGRFMSEYGIQGMPQIKSFNNFIPKDSLFLFSESLKNHQKHPFGFKAINHYMEQKYIIPDDFETYAFISNLLQADGIQIAFDAHLSKMPYCMGSLFWQFNDCWPVISWSAVDYYNQPKAVFYKAKNSFKNYHIAIKDTDDFIEMYIINHTYEDIETELNINLISFNGDTIYSENHNSAIEILSSRLTSRVNRNNFTDTIFNNSFFDIKLKKAKSSEILVERIYTASAPKNLVLQNQDIDYKIIKKEKYYEIELSSNTFIKSLFIYFDNNRGHFSDNYFDLAPNTKKTVLYYPKENSKLNKLIFRSLKPDHVLELRSEDGNSE